MARGREKRAGVMRVLGGEFLDALSRPFYDLCHFSDEEIEAVPAGP